MKTFQPILVVRTLWTKPKSENWWDVVVQQSFEDSDWHMNFRMGRSTFDFSCEELKPFLHKEDTLLRQAISLRNRFAVALWKSATNANYRTVGLLFGISSASVCLILD